MIATMSQSKSLSIRVKILLLLTLLPLSVLGAYLYIAIEVFQNDKIAYVFEGTTSLSRTLSLQTSTELNSILSSSRPILQDFSERQTFGTVSRSLLQVEGPVLWVAAFAKDADGKFVQRAMVSRDQAQSPSAIAGPSLSPSDVVVAASGAIAGSGIVPSPTPPPELSAPPTESQLKLDQILAKGGLLDRIPVNQRTVTIPLKEDNILIGEYVDDPLNGRQFIFLIYAKSEDLWSAFRSPGSSENFLIDAAGKVLMGPAAVEGLGLEDRFALKFLANKESTQPAGTEVVIDPKGENFLVSFSKISFGNLAVVSAVPKKAALQAVTILIRKSIIFFAVLICVTVIVSLVASKNLTASLSQLLQATQKVAQGRFDIRVKVNGTDEVGTLGTSFNRMAAEVSRLMGETAEKARMETELRTAQTVQETLFPPVSAQISDLSVVGFYEPASECGGDWWHYNWVNGKVFLWIGDATGHGAPAALITSAAKSASTIIESLQVDPATALDLLNRSIYDISKGKIMMTFFLACYDPRTRELTYSNASHESPYLIRRHENPPKKRDLIPLNEVNNPRLGQSRETLYTQTSINLAEGDRILFYTDGIPDIQNPKKEAWGEREFIKSVLTSNQDYAPIDESVSRLTKSFQLHRHAAPLIDDITFFMIEVKSGTS
jgi:sigma-B regulation protein RsbU (phosphoserine phosphatase)